MHLFTESQRAAAQNSSRVMFYDAVTPARRRLTSFNRAAPCLAITFPVSSLKINVKSHVPRYIKQPVSEMPFCPFCPSFVCLVFFLFMPFEATFANFAKPASPYKPLSKPLGWGSCPKPSGSSPKKQEVTLRRCCFTQFGVKCLRNCSSSLLKD